MRIAKKYPDIALLKIGRRLDYVINNQDYIRAVLLAPEEQLRRGFHAVLRPLMGNGLLCSQGEFHRNQRRSINPLFHQERVAAFGHTIVQHSLFACEPWRTGETRDIYKDMLHLSFAIIVDVLLGLDAQEARDFGTVVGEVIKTTGRKGYLLKFLAERFPFLPNGRRDHAINRLDKMIYACIFRQMNNPPDRPTLLSMLCEVGRCDDGSKVENLRQVRDEAMTLLVAGHETIATALAWTWYLLSQDELVERKLHEELELVLCGKPPTVDDVPSLPYTTAVLSEAMRLYPPVWTILRRPVENWQLGSYTIPAGSYLWISPYVVHRDPRYFPDPNRFDPSRWNSEKDAERPRFSYFPFGGGGRKCIGEGFAWTEGVLVIATIAQRWKMKLLRGHPVNVAPLVTLRPKYGMRMTLEQRQTGQYGALPV
jgi:cytochrome P450